MQPDENPGGIQDSVVTGDVHHHHYQQPEQIQSDPWGGQQPDHKQPEAVMMGNVSEQPSVLGHPGMVPGQVIMVQTPSSAPVVLGTITIVYGVIMVILSMIALIALSWFGENSSDWGDDAPIRALIGTILVQIVLLTCMCVGGAMMVKRKKMGVQLCLIAIGLSFIFDVGAEILFPEIAALDPNSLGTGINIALSGFCNLFCGLLVSIPLMISNSGLDESSLFS